MKIERARIDASLDVLNMEREAAAAIAEAEVLEAAADSDGDKHSFKLELPLKPEDPEERTSKCVLQHPKSHNSLQSMPEMEPINGYGSAMPQQDRIFPALYNQDNDNNSPLLINAPAQQPVKLEHRSERRYPVEVGQNHGWMRTGGLNDRKRSPAQHHSTPLAGNAEESQSMTDFVRFFARRELVSTGLLQFDDRSESFRAWRA